MNNFIAENCKRAIIYLHPLERGCLHMLTPWRRILRGDKEVEKGEEEFRHCNPVFLSATSCQTMNTFPVVFLHFKNSPFDSSTSAVTRIVKGKSLGMIGLRAFSARAPGDTHKHELIQTQSLFRRFVVRRR